MVTMFTGLPPREDESSQILRLTTTTSTPVTPGPSTPTTMRTPPLDKLKVRIHKDSIVPPARPSSTPFPQQELLEGDIHCVRRLNSNPRSSEYQSQTSDEKDAAPTPTSNQDSGSSTLCNLPIEIHECILDHLFGVRMSTSATPSGSKNLRNWGRALRHSRRKEVSELALVSEQWRQLIQDRLYRHIKIKGTRESVDQAMLWFLENPHLCSYVKHIEFWFPVFLPRTLLDPRSLRIPSATSRSSSLTRAAIPSEGTIATLPHYQTVNNNCTLEEVFRFVQLTFSEACVLSLEGGERKKPPMVRHFKKEGESQSLPTLETIRTLVCKGQWNLLRENDDFQTIAAALPNLVEWHGSYAKPKSKSYLCMATILPRLPENLTNLHLVLENDFRREAVCPSFFRKVAQKTHFCVDMAKAMPALEHFEYTGRVCQAFFDIAASLSSVKVRDSRLKSIDLVVKNVCRPTFQWNDGSGITDMGFILSFEALVLSAVRALDRLTALETLKIRFIDLDSVVPSWNPYFQLENNECTGIWSDPIVDTLAKTRPGALFIEKSDCSGDVNFSKDRQPPHTPPFSKARPLSIKVSSYLSLSGGITIT